MICSICEIEKIEDRFSHNAHPVTDGRCCDACNLLVVVPARVEMYKKIEELI
tara:strand:- start:747 stop:902 length:156 start_codon:yes stop_codon:yes gene_type:complete